MPQTVWTDEMNALLGTVPDREAAVRLGLSRSTVLKQRQALGHSPSRPKAVHIEWTPDMDALLGTATDQVLADRFGLDVRRVIARRKALDIAPPLRRPRIAWTPEMGAVVLACANCEAAIRLGVSSDSVQKRRAKQRLQGDVMGLS